jgi:hypothetical protein
MRSRWKIRFRAKLEGFYSQSSGGMRIAEEFASLSEKSENFTGYWSKHDIIDFLKSQQIRKN